MIVRRGRRINLDSRIMFGSKNADDKLSAALEAYKRDYASRIKNPENMDAQKAAALVEEAKVIVGRSGLGPALAPTLLEHIKHWPSWSKRDDFQKWVGFPATDIRATSEENSKKKEVTGVLFTYKGERYGVRFTDGGSTWLPDGDTFHSGEVDFVAKGETVLGLDVSLDSDEFAQWRWHNVYAFKVGPWTKHLLEIGAHIEESSKVGLKKFREDDVLERAKNIKL
jgi:hypothetical protein